MKVIIMELFNLMVTFHFHCVVYGASLSSSELWNGTPNHHGVEPVPMLHEYVDTDSMESSNFNTENLNSKLYPRSGKRNRFIYTSKSYFSRNPLIEPPRRFWENRQNGKWRRFRTDTEYDNHKSYHQATDHVPPDLSLYGDAAEGHAMSSAQLNPDTASSGYNYGSHSKQSTNLDTPYRYYSYGSRRKQNHFIVAPNKHSYGGHSKQSTNFDTPYRYYNYGSRGKQNHFIVAPNKHSYENNEKQLNSQFNGYDYKADVNQPNPLDYHQNRYISYGNHEKKSNNFVPRPNGGDNYGSHDKETNILQPDWYNYGDHEQSNYFGSAAINCNHGSHSGHRIKIMPEQIENDDRTQMPKLNRDKIISDHLHPDLIARTDAHDISEPTKESLNQMKTDSNNFNIFSDKDFDNENNLSVISSSILPSETFKQGVEGLETDYLLPNEFDLSKSTKIIDNANEPTKTTPLIDTFESSGEMDDSSQEAVSIDKVKSGRLIEIFSRTRNSTECTTPKGEKGHCRSLTECPLSDAVNNYSIFLQYVCLRGIFVGICCPDNPVIEVTDDTEDNSPQEEIKELQQPTDGCGLSPNTRIVGGKFSVPHEWTWMVALMRRNRFYCGGVIINDWYILTAAHCVLGVKVNDLKVRLGEYNFHEKHEHQQDIPVAEIKRHAMFVTLTFQHDIALLKLRRKVEYSKFVGSICLPEEKGRNYSEVNATVVGWGTVSFGGAASSILRQVTIPVWANEDCDKTYFLERINESFMCAGAPGNGEDACQGDSGGPLMALSSEGRWEVIGIVSWGRRCGDPTYPGVYTRVTSYLDWIAENVK